MRATPPLEVPDYDALQQNLNRLTWENKKLQAENDELEETKRVMAYELLEKDLRIAKLEKTKHFLMALLQRLQRNQRATSATRSSRPQSPDPPMKEVPFNPYVSVSRSSRPANEAELDDPDLDGEDEKNDDEEKAISLPMEEECDDDDDDDDDDEAQMMMEEPPVVPEEKTQKLAAKPSPAPK